MKRNLHYNSCQNCYSIISRRSQWNPLKDVPIRKLTQSPAFVHLMIRLIICFALKGFSVLISFTWFAYAKI